MKTISEIYKPCPFCGHEVSHARELDGVAYVFCEKCGAQGPKSKEGFKNAENLWNHRHDPCADDLKRESYLIGLRLGP